MIIIMIITIITIIIIIYPWCMTEQLSYLTRSAANEKLSIEHYTTNLRKFCPAVIGKYIWNNIPLSIRSKSPKKVFKKYLQRFFLAQY